MPFDLRAFRSAYSSFLRNDRILLTGHSHQAWPDVARDAMTKYFEASAELVDDKWSADVLPLMDRVGRRILSRLGFDPGGAITFGKSTHELVFRLLTCLPRNPRIVTTTGEFHSLDRQLCRLAEEGADVVWVSREPSETIIDRMLIALEQPADLVALSAVLFEDSFVVQGIDRLLDRAKDVGALALVDAYHAFNVLPLELSPSWERTFVTAGGYKYAQFGEGVCFLRVPDGCEERPVYTGWFADFDSLDAERSSRGVRTRVSYGRGGARFAGATFDPVSFYRADAVLEHFDRFELGVAELRSISVRQTERIAGALEEAHIPLVSSRSPERRGGFVAARVARASDVVHRLRERGVYVDARGDKLRLGPAPYLSDEEIDRGVRAAIAAIRSV
jgi:selenocysteine lyase/cysteine desulfurase